MSDPDQATQNTPSPSSPAETNDGLTHEEQMERERARRRRISSGGHAINSFKLINPPPDKQIQMISERDLERGLYVEWELYTEAHFKADQAKYGTRFPVKPRIAGERLMVKLHFPVFIPKEDWNEMQRIKSARRRALQSPIHDRSGPLREGEFPKKRVQVYAGKRGWVENVDEWDGPSNGRRARGQR